MEMAFSARTSRIFHEIFSCPFVFLVVKNYHPALLRHHFGKSATAKKFVPFRAFRGKKNLANSFKGDILAETPLISSGEM